VRQVSDVLLDLVGEGTTLRRHHGEEQMAAS
jgi:hypothetical protein